MTRSRTLLLTLLAIAMLAILMLNHPLKHELLKLVHRLRTSAVSVDKAG